MERLTKRHGKHAVQIGAETRRNDLGWQRLAEIEDLAEQGRLAELPVQEGTQVYILWGPKYRAGKNEYGINTGEFRLSDMPNLNKTVFITRAEAEARLAELEGEK